MEHTFKWFLHTSIRSKDKYFEFDITEYCKVYFGNESYLTRQTTFDKQAEVDKATIDSIEQVKIKLYPFTVAPMSNTNEAERIIEAEIGKFPDFQHIINRGNLRHAHGLVIVEIKFNGDFTYSENLKLDEEKDIEKVLNWNIDFDILRLRMISIANDICSFFIFGLHLTYPTHSNSHESTKPQSSGLLFMAGNTKYVLDEHSDILAYPLLVEKERFDTLKEIWAMLAKVWHKDIWSFHRFIKAVRSDYITIDNFLDLVFTLESFFGNDTSTETMRLVSSLIVAKNKSEASKINQLLIDCFRIRNEVAHGGVHYRLYDKIPRKPKGDEKHKMILELFWELKNLNISLMVYGIQKLINDRNPIPASAIRLGPSDIEERYFSNDFI
ncbi:hypothetical protein [Mucilaginibacter sp. L3T2-6]|uniref:hypothetical protein n=1 Tax=Mucilaginibacter sp. L3T2-6 TaxID=3062491 RepID=UPI00267463DD|nr:hypothetical protein [Mucilaginibacter sp. L3T2-6]MDO3645303.1 hypothetical protein [Mucilaginibacter sp. L3T2-6]MDV6217796.1 hypothetical protein [Mucilaginibacter sp. L3T2-6]